MRKRCSWAPSVLEMRIFGFSALLHFLATFTASESQPHGKRAPIPMVLNKERRERMERQAEKRHAPAPALFTTLHAMSTPEPLSSWELDRLLRQFHIRRGERGATSVEALLFVAAMARCDLSLRDLVANGLQEVDLAPDGSLVWGDLYCAE
jgi:hypothetical protein